MALQRMQLDDNMVIWIEAEDNLEAFPDSTSQEATRNSRSATQQTNQALQRFADMQNTIKAFASYTLNSFRQIANANVNKVTLEFGINVGGEAGIPYVTKGSMASNIKITVECTFPNNNTSS